jgi:hypothetical protein
MRRRVFQPTTNTEQPATNSRLQTYAAVFWQTNLRAGFAEKADGGLQLGFKPILVFHFRRNFIQKTCLPAPFGFSAWAIGDFLKKLWVSL